MRSRTDVAGLSCAVVSGRGGGLTCAAAVVVLYRQPRRACRAAGVRGGAPRGGGWAREERRPQDTPPARSAEGARVKTSQNFPFCDPAGLSLQNFAKGKFCGGS